MKKLTVTGLVLLVAVVFGQVLVPKTHADVSVPTLFAASAMPAESDGDLLSSPPPLPDSLPALPPVAIQHGLEEFIRLVKSGAGEDVLRGYVRGLPAIGELSADELIYLSDIGTPQPVIVELLNRAAELRRTAVPAIPPAAAAPVPPPATPAVVPPPAEVNDAAFYQALSPYGTWLAVGGSWGWQPAVAVVDAAWRPYCQGGRWIYTDCGWTWYSDYSWGWAPFHYGRWLRHRNHGWMWFPGTIWGPAWVSWRSDDSHCGWAPLPPAARYSAAAGLVYYGQNVGVSFGFGLAEADYVFVEFGRFCDPAPYRHLLPAARVTGLFKRTAVHNNYTHRGRLVINGGPDVRRMEQLRGQAIPQRTLVDDARAAGRRGPGEDPRQNTFSVYRPVIRSQIRPATSVVSPAPQVVPLTSPPVSRAPEKSVTAPVAVRRQQQQQEHARSAADRTEREGIERKRQAEAAANAAHQQQELQNQIQVQAAAQVQAIAQAREAAREAAEARRAAQFATAENARREGAFRQQREQAKALADAQRTENFRQAAELKKQQQEEAAANAARQQHEQQARSQADSQARDAARQAAAEARQQAGESQRRATAVSGQERVKMERAAVRPADSSSATDGTTSPRGQGTH